MALAFDGRESAATAQRLTNLPALAGDLVISSRDFRQDLFERCAIEWPVATAQFSNGTKRYSSQGTNPALSKCNSVAEDN